MAVSPRPGRSEIRHAGASGGARKDFIATVRTAVDQFDQGRGAAACMSDIKAALAAMDVRSPKNQHHKESDR